VSPAFLAGLIIGWFVGTILGAVAMGLATGPHAAEPQVPPLDLTPSLN
jgi:hypothetical protein